MSATCPICHTVHDMTVCPTCWPSVTWEITGPSLCSAEHEPNVVCPNCGTPLGARWLTQDDVEPEGDER